ncbi:Crp/Fnr family transcriptional regulator [Streptomyces sp. NBC_01477]|uniref:Crp/Fnr family transcriptional regulator n=1 Tax=Streptomyces sp. NBC_01477 TaxID=2976015 RepID=UPI002E325C36|nr:Crp/Fnr family transcriptional regulator [Streptomyces sp. NBC_01477]
MGVGASGMVVTFWSSLEVADREALAGLGAQTEVAADTQMFAQGDSSDYLLVVLRGWVKVVSHSAGGYRALLALRGPGDLLGEQAGLDGRRRSASLYAATDVVVLRLTAARFQHFARGHPAVNRAVEQTLSRRLQEADRQRAGFTEPVSVRLAALLLDLADRCGEPARGAGAVSIGLPLSQDDLAGLLLSSRRTVSRVLEQWRAQGLVATGRKSLHLLQADRLKSLAQGG